MRKSLGTLAAIGLFWGHAVAVADPGKDEAGNIRSHESKWVKERQEADREAQGARIAARIRPKRARPGHWND
jgi:hypothetical protein